eukprot:scaffold1053_cov332-Pavlova_lutheri.AAC.14
MSKTSASWLIANVSLLFVCGALAACPPQGYDSVSPFDLDKYVGDPWYVLQQLPISYQPLEELFCVRAQYTQTEARGIFKRRRGDAQVSVLNSASRDGVEGEAFTAELLAIVPDIEDPSKLAVGPTFLPSILYGPYWVVAAGPEDTERYEWAIVTGGPPTVETADGCTTGTGVNDSGFWLFSRTALPSNREELVSELRGIAEGLGLDTSVLVNVPQEGCTYP